MSLTHIFYGGNGTTPVDSGLPRVGVIHGVGQKWRFALVSIFRTRRD